MTGGETCPSELVVFYNAETPQLAAVLPEAGGQSNTIAVLTESGDQRTLSNTEVAYRTVGTAPDCGSDWINSLKQLSALIAAEGEIDLELLAESVPATDLASVDPELLTDVWFGSCSLPQRLAMALAIARSINATWVEVPREKTSEQPEEVPREKQITFLDAVLRVLRANGPSRQARLQSLCQSGDYEAPLDALVRLAAGQRSVVKPPDKHHLARLLKKTAPRGIGHIDPTPLAAFELLLELGVVSEHQNLALRRHGVVVNFAAEAIAAAAGAASLDPLGPASQHGVARPGQPVEQRIHHDHDFTNRFLVTIDDPHSLDLDDAIHCHPRADGGAEIGIHIALPAPFVPLDGPLMAAASERGISLYLPSRTLPLLPASLSDQRLSLVSGQTREALTLMIDAKSDGSASLMWFQLSRIRVDQRLSYGDADRVLDSPDHPLFASLRFLADFAMKSEERRKANGALTVDLPKIKVLVDPGAKIRLLKQTRNGSRAIIAELMVLAGELTGLYCRDHEVPVLFRKQAKLDLEAASAILNAGLEKHVTWFELLKLMKRSSVGVVPGPHSGLALDAYVQVSSPLRRMSDLLVNHQLYRLLTRQPLLSAEALEGRLNDSESARQSRVFAGRERDRYWIFETLRRDKSRPAEGVLLNPEPGRKLQPLILTETMIKTYVQPTGLSPGQTVRVRLRRVEPRGRVLRVRVI